MSLRHSIIRKAGALALVGAVAASLAACSSSASSADADADYGDITVQLDWLKNHEFAGLFVADDAGYFADEGFGTVTFNAGGIGGVSAATALTSGQAWIAFGGVADVAAANEEGADLRIVATTYQKNPYTLVSATSDPIDTPQDLIGKTIAIADASRTSWEAFLAANDIDESQIDVVPYADAESDLKLGNIDGFMGYGDGGAQLRADGFGAQEFLLADYGLTYGAEAVVVTADTLADEPEKIEAFLDAYAHGWYDAFQDSDHALDLVVDDYGKDQNWDKTSLELSWTQQSKLILTDESKAGGIGTVSDDALANNIAALALVGYDTTAEDTFDTTLIADVYAQHPEWILGADFSQ
ncbi:MAG: ABC transporter substrate-binding protein [Microbacterium sp.]